MEGIDNWDISILATDQALITEYITQIRFATSLQISVIWPHGILSRPQHYIATRNKILKSLDFVIISGLPTELELTALLVSFYLPWGIAPDLTIFI